MRFILLFVGITAAVFLIPMFMDIWDGVILPASVSVTDPTLRMFYVIAPYAVVIVIAIAAFLVVIGRRER